MAVAKLTIDLGAAVANWRALADKSAGNVETAAVVKADAYGLGVAPVGQALAHAGAQSFFVAAAEEGVTLRKAIGAGPVIYIFSGLMDGDLELTKDWALTPLLNSAAQVANLPSDLPYGVQLDTGMNRLGMEVDEFLSVKDNLADAKLVISHLACADEPGHSQNTEQLAAFREMTCDFKARRSLAATGGTLLGADFHFDLTRPGVGLYGGAPYLEAKSVVTLDLPVIQTRLVKSGESVGYGAAWIAKRNSVVATVAAGYADGLIRAMCFKPLSLFAGSQKCPMIGRVSMDLITVDVTDIAEMPTHLDLLNENQTVDDLAEAANTIGYEILTSLGQRYERRYLAA